MSSPIMRLAVLLVAGIVFASVVVWWNRSDVAPSEQKSLRTERSAPDLPDPEPLESPYLNPGSIAEYVGNEACTECHQDEHESYHLTAHSLALRKVDLEQEPPDAEYYHELSNRWYKVYRDGDAFRHRESVRDEEGEELVLHDRVVEWAIGSGRFSQSYLSEDGDFLLESPITWYTARQNWEMSPGYDQPYHKGFERLADWGCLVCHAGRVETVGGNMFKPDVVQMTIGCESCHGPGSVHVAKRQDLSAEFGDEDFTIVNPADLSRDLAESICANCHLRGEATVFRRGRSFDDFRPGLALTDVRVDYGIRDTDGEMKVVGHVEQMRLSRCYTESESMTCTTCHDPHNPLASDSRVQWYRQRCLNCHSNEACGLTLQERHLNDFADNCVTCHMPKTDTDIPHFAFTHHRVGVHGKEERRRSLPRSVHDELFALLPPDSMGDEERNRLLGLAYLELAEKQPGNYMFILETARRHLREGERDGEALAGLARIDLELRRGRADEWADLALQSESLSSRSRVNALVAKALAARETDGGGPPVAEFQELTNLRRSADYWFLLSRELGRAHRDDEMLAALQRAVEIAPHRIDFRQALFQVYVNQGREKDARAQARAIDILQATQ